MNKRKTPRRVNYSVVRQAGKACPGWMVLRESRRVESFFEKTAAVREARRLARGEACASLRVHGRNGRIQSEWSYPRRLDPRRTKG